MKIQPLLLAGAGLVLLTALVLCLVPLFASDATVRITRPLAEVVPNSVAGWQVETLDVADSAEMRNRVERLLEYDDVIYRAYRKGGTEVQVYVAYWKPGSVPYGQAGVHTPDTCWVNAGWQMQDKVNGRVVRCGERTMKPVEARRFGISAQKLYVMFWHLVGDRVHGYEQYGWRDGLAGYRERLPLLFKDLRRYGFNLAQEQLFVRVSTNVDFETLLKDPAFVALMDDLKPLGIFES